MPLFVVGFSFFRCFRKIIALYATREESSPNIDRCTLCAVNCVQSRYFVLLFCLLVCVFVYSLQLKKFFFQCFFFFSCICLFITTLISSYFFAWPSHSARLSLLFLSGCALSFFHNYFLLLNDSTFLYQEHNKDCRCLIVVAM